MGRFHGEVASRTSKPSRWGYGLYETWASANTPPAGKWDSHRKVPPRHRAEVEIGADIPVPLVPLVPIGGYWHYWHYWH
jgi:hypothetical protein